MSDGIGESDEGTPEFTLWTLTKGDRIARAAIRTVEGRREARFYIDNAVVFSQLFRPDDETGARALTAQKRQEFIDRGWGL